MTVDEEKTLSDEALEEVSGGMTPAVRREFEKFARNNCMHCSRKVERDCPYGDGMEALQALGEDGICPEKEART